MAKFLVRLKITFRKLINRCPRRIKVFLGPLLGGIIGLIGGIPGFFIGLLLGYFIRELFIQSFRDRRVIDYFENPGLQQFHEGEPGLAAWCALAVLVSSAEVSAGAEVPAGAEISKSPQAPAERILKQVILEASCIFTGPLVDPFQMEHFSRLALSKRNSLNPDLLAESLVARRASLGQASAGYSSPEGRRNSRDLGKLGRGLSNLAGGEKGRRLAREIRLILDPASGGEADNFGSGIQGVRDPWKILGLPPGTPPGEVKAHYRRLAKQFHPDELAVLDEQRRETAARAFMAIKEAYQEVAGR